MFILIRDHRTKPIDQAVVLSTPERTPTMPLIGSRQTPYHTNEGECPRAVDELSPDDELW